MSFRQNGRYGYVPPAQYHPGQETGLGIQRRSSFDNGDDANFVQGPANGPPAVPAHLNNSSGQRGQGSGPNDELYLNGPVQDPRNASARPPYPISTPAMSGYQHQYQPQAPTAASTTPITPVYNPQQFARTYSQSQPAAAPYNPQIFQNQNYTSHQPYNPAAYQQASIQRQPTLPSYVQTPVHAPPHVSQTTAYWPTANYGNAPPAPPPPRPASQQVYDQPLHSPPYTTPGSAPLPLRPSPYSPPIPSSPYSTNGGSYMNNDSVTPAATLPPYPTQSQMPMGEYSSTYDDPTSFSARMSSSSSHNANPLPSPSAPVEPVNSTLQRHPTRRPLPSAPVDEESEDDYDEAQLAEQIAAQEQIYQEIEAAVGTGPSHTRDHRSQTVDQPHRDLLDTELGDLHRFNSRATTLNPTSIDRYGSTASTLTQNTQDVTYNYDYDDSDAEATAGLEAMRIAEEQEARRGSTGFGLYDANRDQRPSQQASQDVSSDSDYENVDMGLYGGGYDAHMSYGGDLTLSHVDPGSEMEDQSRPLPTPDELRRTEGHEPAPGLGGQTDYSVPLDTSIHPFPAFDSRIDSFGTGGLQRPDSQGHRLSFDEGDERASLDSRFTDSRLSGRSGSESPSRDDMPDMFYHPGMSAGLTGRPLPAVPSLAENRTPQLQPAGSYRNPQTSTYAPDTRQYYVPDGPDAYPQDMTTPVSQFVPRSASLTSHSSAPQVIPPVRSRTDAEERQARQRAVRQQGISGPGIDGFESGTPQTAVSVDLPTLPPGGRRAKLDPQALKHSDFKKCTEPWALSGLAAWARDICGGETGEGETDLKEKTVAECLTLLFTHKVYTMNTADAETLSDRVIKEMLDASVLIRDEEWVKFGQGHISGVLWQLTGSGCYAPKLHESEIHGRCYSYYCSRTLKKINLQTTAIEPARKLEPWHVFFKLTKEQIEKADKKEIQRQNNLHEIVMSEDVYMDRLNVLRLLYRDTLKNYQPAIIKEGKVDSFVNKVFGKVEAIKQANENHLLSPLKYRQQEQGPWITGFSDIFREWVRKARQVYLEYAAGYPEANFLVRREADRNGLFKQFLDQARENKLSDRLDWNTYLFAPLKRLQQYTLLLREVLKHSLVDNEEKTNLMTAIEEINNVTLECDAKVDEVSKKVEMEELHAKLILRPGMRGVDLGLKSFGRELIFKGDLQRAGANRFTWLETHVLLFDNYLVMAKTTQSQSKDLRDRYDVSKLPIPMQLLVLESTNDEPVVKSSVKGLGAVTTVTRQVPQQDPRLSRTSTNNDRPGLEHSNSNTSSNTTSSTAKMITSTNLEGDARAMYPFRIKHLGRSEVYTLYAPSLQNRQEWCDKIIEAKARHAASLFSQHAEPFRLKVLADSAFAYETSALVQNRSSIIIKGTPLDRAIRDMEREHGNVRPSPVCRAMVNCAITFTCFGKSMIAIGTDFGVYTTEVSNPRGWTRSIQMTRVTQIAVLEEFNSCLIIADKALIAYHLDVVVPVSNFPAPQHHDSARRAPQKLSGQRDVSFFATARMKDRTLVFYKKREGLSSTFKVLEPILQKSTEKKSKLFSRARLSGGGNTDFFREFDEFYIPAECFSINLFHSYIAISTARGFELLTLDKKVPMSIPDLREPSIASIAARLNGQKPLGMFRLSDAEFLLCYDECGVYIDKHGEVSRSVIMEFVGRAKTATMYGNYLVLFDNDFVEIRNAENGRLRQVIAGKDVRCLDQGVPGAGQSVQRTLKLAMAHPENNGSQLILEMVLNEGQQD